jgi:cob(I)alamin adenosyltransferase
MGTIATTRGETGQTGLAGGIRVSKSSVRVEAYGTIDQLNSALGFARSICEDREMVELARSIQQDLW